MAGRRDSVAEISSDTAGLWLERKAGTMPNISGPSMKETSLRLRRNVRSGGGHDLDALTL